MNRHYWMDPRLASIPLFRDLSRRQLRTVSGVATALDLRRGKVLISEGGVGHEFFIIKDGWVEVRRGTQVIATRGAGDYVGEIALLERRRRTATVVAGSPVAVEVIAQREFHGLMDRLPTLAERIRVIAEHRLAELETRACA